MDWNLVELGVGVAIYGAVLVLMLVPSSPVLWVPAFAEGIEEGLGRVICGWSLITVCLFLWFSMFFVTSLNFSDHINMFMRGADLGGVQRDRLMMHDNGPQIVTSGGVLMTLVAAFIVWWLGLGFTVEQQTKMKNLIIFLLPLMVVTKMVLLCKRAPRGL